MNYDDVDGDDLITVVKGRNRSYEKMVKLRNTFNTLKQKRLKYTQQKKTPEPISDETMKRFFIDKITNFINETEKFVDEECWQKKMWKNTTIICFIYVY